MLIPCFQNNPRYNIYVNFYCFECELPVLKRRKRLRFAFWLFFVPTQSFAAAPSPSKTASSHFGQTCLPSGISFPHIMQRSLLKTNNSDLSTVIPLSFRFYRLHSIIIRRPYVKVCWKRHSDTQCGGLYPRTYRWEGSQKVVLRPFAAISSFLFAAFCLELTFDLCSAFYMSRFSPWCASLYIFAALW